MSDRLFICILLLLTQAWAASDSDARTIVEQWGDTADISNCYFNSVQIGEDQDFLIAQSNESQVKDISKISFAHSVYMIKTCTRPGAESDPRSLLQSI